MDKKHSFSIVGCICLIIAVYVICYLLYQDTAEPLSINAVWSSISHWPKHFRIIAVGLLPVYVALMVFGTAIFAKYIGSVLQRWLTALLIQK
jgi:uncharacterized membrane protein YbhN (UPF0104 family)